MVTKGHLGSQKITFESINKGNRRTMDVRPMHISQATFGSAKLKVPYSPAIRQDFYPSRVSSNY